VPAQSAHPAAAAEFASFINTSPSGLNVDITPFSADGKGRGLFPAATARGSVPAFNTPTARFAANTNQIFSEAADHVNTDFEWSPWTQDLETELGVEASAAVAGSTSVGQALEKTQQTIILYAQQEGDTIKVLSK
jgi:multiple sugar transport system substrate-binding protein